MKNLSEDALQVISDTNVSQASMVSKFSHITCLKNAQKCKESSRACAAASIEQRAAVERLLSEFRALDKEVETLRDANHREILQKEVANAKLQVNLSLRYSFL